MAEKQRLDELLGELRLLRSWVESNTRRIEELEATTFQLEDCEEVVLVTVPRRHNETKPR